MYIVFDCLFINSFLKDLIVEIFCKWSKIYPYYLKVSYHVEFINSSLILL